MTNRLDLFISNTQTMSKEFKWQESMTRRLAALIYAQEGKQVAPESIRRCQEIIKKNTGIFSTFRGNMALCIATLLSLTPNPQELFADTLKVYDLLKSVKLRASDFLVIAAFEIAKQANTTDFAKIAERTRAFYDGMKSNRFFATGEDDYIFAAMLALSDLDVTSGIERVERINARLRGEFSDKNSVQHLSQVLVLGGSDENVACRVLALRDSLRQQKIKLDKTETLSSLGILALLPVEIDTIVRDIIEVQSALRGQKGFGSLSVSTQELLLFAASIVASEYAQSTQDGVLTATVSTSITNIIIAQQAAMMAVMVAAYATMSTTATTATTSS